jgi:hypothetical protein
MPPKMSARVLFHDIRYLRPLTRRMPPPLLRRCRLPMFTPPMPPPCRMPLMPGPPPPRLLLLRHYYAFADAPPTRRDADAAAITPLILRRALRH